MKIKRLLFLLLITVIGFLGINSVKADELSRLYLKNYGMEQNGDTYLYWYWFPEAKDDGNGNTIYELAPENIVSYNIYRKASADFEYQKIASMTATEYDTSYGDTGLNTSDVYTYYVEAVLDDESTIASYPVKTNGEKVCPNGKYTIMWAAEPMAELLNSDLPTEGCAGEYISVYANMNSFAYDLVSATFIENKEEGLNITDEVGFDTSSNYGSNMGSHVFKMPSEDLYIRLTFNKVYNEKPAKISLKLTDYRSIRLSWSSCEQADGYYVYLKYGSNNYFLKGTTTKTYIDLKNLNTGQKVYLKVVPYAMINRFSGGIPVKVSSKSYTATYTYTLKKMNTPTVKKYNSKKVQVKWTKVNGATKYQIARSLYKTKNYSVVKTVGSGYVGFKLNATKNKTYYYKVRACKGNICGPWSNYKSFKLK